MAAVTMVIMVAEVAISRRTLVGLTAPITMEPVDEAAVMAALAEVPDPEIPVVSVVDLGIVRGIQRDPPAVLITPTYSGCPATLAIELSVREALGRALSEHCARWHDHTANGPCRPQPLAAQRPSSS